MFENLIGDKLGSLDIAMILLYLVAMAALGIWYGRGVKTGKDLFLGGRSLPWWAVGTSLVVSDIGAKDMVGMADDGYRHGIVMMNFDFMGCIFPVLLAAFLIMPYLWLAGVYTIPEYLGRRYNPSVRTIFALMWGFFMIATIAIIYVSAATMMNGLLGWNFWFSVCVTALLVGLYTTIGGLKAVVITDFVSCIILIIGAALICIIGLNEVGGWEQLQAKVAKIPDTEHHFSLLRPADSKEYAWPAVLLGLGFVLGPAYWIGNQAIIQRTLGTRSAREARASYILCAAIKLVFPVLLVVPGLIGLALFYDKLGSADAKTWVSGSVLPMVVQLLPKGILGIVLGAFLAGVMSNLDSYVNSAATMCVNDIYKPLLAPNADERETMIAGRIMIVVFLVIGIGLSWFVFTAFKSVFEAFQTFISFIQGPLFALLILGMLTKRVTQWGGLFGLVIGFLSAILMWFGDIYFLWVAWWAFVISLVVTITVSMVTKPYDDERLRGLVYWLPLKED